MAKGVRITDDMYRLALAESQRQERSIAQQVEYWAKLGMQMTLGGTAVSDAENERFLALESTATKSREHLGEDVRQGRLNAQALSWFQREYVSSVTLDVPEYR